MKTRQVAGAWVRKKVLDMVEEMSKIRNAFHRSSDVIYGKRYDNIVLQLPRVTCSGKAWAGLDWSIAQPSGCVHLYPKCLNSYCVY